MSPEVAAGLRDQPCGCGAEPGERCRSYLTGQPMAHVHADRVYRALFGPTKNGAS